MTTTSASSSNERMERLGAKIAELAARDTEMNTFGASTFGHGHHYRMNPTLSLAELAAFEREYDVQLPKDYANFLTQIGNGGIGPYYGLYSLAESVPNEHKSREFLASSFPLTELFDPSDMDKENDDDDDEDEEEDDKLLDFEFKYICGSIELSHQGCAYYDRLVITGPQAGQVWSISDQLIIEPLGCDFYTWYDRWVTNALDKLGPKK